jgi:ribose transport system permease protein
MCVALALLNDRFLTATNLLNIGRQVSLLGIMAVGHDLRADLGRGGPVGRLHLRLRGPRYGHADPGGLAARGRILAGVACGAVIGVVNGLLSTYGRLPSLIATLGTLSMVRGLALILTDGRPVTVNARNGRR